MQLSSNDFGGLAGKYLGAAKALLTWRQSHPLEDQSSRDQFNNAFSYMLNIADRLENQALQPALLGDVGVFVRPVQEGIQRAEAALEQIRGLPQVLLIVKAIAGMGAAVLNPSEERVNEALRTLDVALKSTSAV
jgi:hypothetical protein